MDNKDFEEDFLPIDDDFLPLTPIEEVKEENNIEKESLEQEIDKQTILDITSPSIFDNPIIEEKKEELPINDLANQTIFIDAKKEEIKEKKKFNFGKLRTNLEKYAKALPVIAFSFVSVLGIYIFVNNVKADIKNLIKIEENSKVGYIDNDGETVVRPKFLYGTDFYKGYAIVKNYNSLFGVIDGKGDNEIAFGNIFSASLYGNRYIISKFTNDGLKMGLLDSNLKEITRYKYDNLAYSKAGVFLYTEGDTMGIMNNDGKEIYSYKVDEVDDKNISIEVSNLDDKSSSDTYAKIKVNSSSTIINTNTGKEVYKYTLDDIRVLDNNVFYIRNEDGNNKYFVIKDDKIIYETTEYKRLRVEDLNSYIAIAIKEDASIDYINMLNKEKINKEGNVEYTYSDGVVVQEMYNFSSSKVEYTVITPKKILSTFSNIKSVDNTYVNGYMKIVTDNDKYSFINKKGNIITKKEYEEVTDFNKNGFAIVSNDGSYGVIDSSGKEILDLKYDNIKFLDDTLFNNIYKKTKEQLFIFEDNNKYGIINANGKVLVKAIYSDFKTVTTKYPIIKVKYNNENMLLNLESYKDLNIDSSGDVQIYEDYIATSDSYFNYNGEVIYKIGG